MPIRAALVILALVSPPAPAQAPPPPLPVLPLGTYPSSMRQAVAGAYDHAKAHSSDAAAVGALGRLLQAWEQWDAAHDTYARAEALAPGVFDWHYLDACVLQRLARPADAVARLRAAIAISPDYLPARARLADALFDTGNLHDSQQIFEALLRQPATEPVALFGLGRIAASEGRHTEAVDRIQQALTLFPEWGAAQYSLALSLRALGRRDEAERALERYAQFGARWPALDDPVLTAVTGLRDDATVRLRKGQALAKAGDLEGAIAEYEAALELDPSLALAHEDLIKLYGQTENWAKADAHYRAVIALGRNSADMQYDYGVLMGLQQKWDLAAAAYRTAIELNPLHARAHNNLGQLFERSRQFDAALDEYLRAIDSQPTFRLARFNAGRALVALGRPLDAVAQLSRLIEPRDAETPRYLFALAVAHVRAGNRTEGIKWATEANQLAEHYGQLELAASIQRELAALK